MFIFIIKSEAGFYVSKMKYIDENEEVLTALFVFREIYIAKQEIFKIFGFYMELRLTPNYTIFHQTLLSFKQTLL